MVLKNIYKSFGSIEVLKDFNLTIADGEHVALMGKSGKGKTTILNIIMGFEKPDSGETDITKSISAVFQEDRLSEDFSAISNVCLLKKKQKTAREILYIFDEALKGLDEKTKAIAMSVINEYTKGRSVLFVTHDINEAKEFADRIVEI